MTIELTKTYDAKSGAEVMGVSEEFLVGLIGRAVKAGVIKLLPGWKVKGGDLMRLGKTYYSQIERELLYQARLRVDARDRAELQERLERGKAS